MPPAADDMPLGQRARALLQLGVSLRRLPPRVALFYARAVWTARRTDDDFARRSGTRPRELADLLSAARGCRRVVELGTGSAWTAIALALDDPERKVVTYDPVVRPGRDEYLALLRPEVRARIELRTEMGESGPPDGTLADFVFVARSHERKETVATFEAWRKALAPEGIVAFHDWEEPLYPGVTEAIRDLGLVGDAYGHLFVWRNPARAVHPAASGSPQADSPA